MGGCAVTALAMVVVLFPLGMALMGWAYRNEGGGSPEAWDQFRTGLICLAVLAGSWLIVIHAIWRRWAEVTRSPNHCHRCGYDLRGTPGKSCPECGQPVAQRP